MTQHGCPAPIQRTFSILLVLAAAAVAQAHPGHGFFEHGGAHLVASPFHALTLALLGAGLVFAARLARAPRLRAGLRVTATVCVVLAAILWIGR